MTLPKNNYKDKCKDKYKDKYKDEYTYKDTKRETGEAGGLCGESHFSSTYLSTADCPAISFILFKSLSYFLKVF